MGCLNRFYHPLNFFQIHTLMPISKPDNELQNMSKMQTPQTN
jgi:hypothetical protein